MVDYGFPYLGGASTWASTTSNMQWCSSRVIQKAETVAKGYKEGAGRASLALDIVDHDSSQLSGERRSTVPTPSRFYKFICYHSCKDRLSHTWNGLDP